MSATLTGSPVVYQGASFIAREGDEILEALRAGRPFEARELCFVKSFLSPGQTFWDIGANFGLFAVVGAKAVGPSGKVLAFEPDPANLLSLRANIELNRLRNVEVAPLAVSNTPGTAEFCSCSQGAYSGFRVAEVPGTVERITVRTTSLDTYHAQQGRPAVHFVKIDVEGAESLVFEGGEQFLGESPRPVVMCEFSDRRSVAFNRRCRDLYAWLADRRYQWFALDANGRLVQAPPRDVYDYDNLVGCPLEKRTCLLPWML